MDNCAPAVTRIILWFAYRQVTVSFGLRDNSEDELHQDRLQPRASIDSDSELASTYRQEFLPLEDFVAGMLLKLRAHANEHAPEMQLQLFRHRTFAGCCCRNIFYGRLSQLAGVSCF